MAFYLAVVPVDDLGGISEEDEQQRPRSLTPPLRRRLVQSVSAPWHSSVKFPFHKMMFFSRLLRLCTFIAIMVSYVYYAHIFPYAGHYTLCNNYDEYADYVDCIINMRAIDSKRDTDFFETSQ
jgi:hypothetical protein